MSTKAPTLIIESPNSYCLCILQLVTCVKNQAEAEIDNIFYRKTCLGSCASSNPFLCTILITEFTYVTILNWLLDQ